MSKALRRAAKTATAAAAVLAVFAGFPVLTAAQAVASARVTFPVVSRVSGQSLFTLCAGGDPTPFSLGSETEALSVVNPTDPRNIVTIWQQDRYVTGSSRGIAVAVTHDGGRAWQPVPVPALSCPVVGGRTTNPWIGFTPDGTLHATATVSGSRSQILLSTSVDGGLTWSGTVTLIDDPRSSNFNDKQATTADPGVPSRVYAVWNRRTNSANRHDVMFTRSVDGGLTWSAARSIYAPPSPAATSGSQIVVLPDGRLVNVFFQNDRPIGTPPGPALTDHILAIRSADGGETWSAPVTIADLRLNIPLVPGTSSIIVAPGLVPDVAVDRLTGTVYAVWGDGTLSTSGSAVALASSHDGGQTWTTPRIVGETPESAVAGIGQAFLPQVDVSALGTVAVSYLDLRNDTAAAGAATDVWLSTCWGPWCGHPGAQWHERHLAGPFDIATACSSFGGPFIGTYVGLTHRPGLFLATVVMTTADAANPQDVYVISSPATPWVP